MQATLNTFIPEWSRLALSKYMYTSVFYGRKLSGCFILTSHATICCRIVFPEIKVSNKQRILIIFIGDLPCWHSSRATTFSNTGGAAGRYKLSLSWACGNRLFFFCESELINMTLAWDREKIWVPNRNWTHDLLYTGWVLYPLSCKNSWRARSFNWVDVWQASCILLGSAVEVIVSVTSE